MLNVGENYSLNSKKLLKDNTKYRILFESDFAYSFDSEFTNKLDAVYREGDKEKFKDVFNEYADKNNLFYKIREVQELCGPGGNWPVVTFETIKPATIRNIIARLAEEFFGDEEETVFCVFCDWDYVDVIEVVK